MDLGTILELLDQGDYLRGNFTISHPARSLNTTFQPSTTRPTLCIYSVDIATQATRGAGTGTDSMSGRIELRSDVASPPTEEQDRFSCDTTITCSLPIGSSVTVNDKPGGILCHLVKPRHNVLIATVNVVGAPAYTLRTSTEITL